ncbi:unnamed protein product [Chrysodeixis includens]|uniref:Uncharacterized protein n=1 Tax=Chrysodeixis includens TaxID=689277 RepID=A0A9N8Q2R5_CHRIL|nr:unnamed protein product [Chrysodeixis includens]
MCFDNKERADDGSCVSVEPTASSKEIEEFSKEMKKNTECGLLNDVLDTKSETGAKGNLLTKATKIVLDDLGNILNVNKGDGKTTKDNGKTNPIEDKKERIEETSESNKAIDNASNTNTDKAVDTKPKPSADETLDPKEEDALIPKLNQLLGEPKSGSGSLKNDLFDRRERINDRSERFGKSVLVKRIVPHGYRSSNYEYDAKLNTLYKPLIRYHIRKPVEPQNRDLLSDIEADQKERDGSNNAVVVLLQRQRNEDYDQSGQDLEVRSSSDKDLLRQIQKFLSKNSARPKGKKSKLKKRFRGLLSTYKNSEGDLRTTFVQKSGEEHDPYAPGKLPPIVASEEHVTQKPKASLPKYSFWNYWTTKSTRHLSGTIDQHPSATVDQHLSATYDRHLSVTGDRHLSVTVDQHLSATVDQHLSATYDRHLSVTGDRHLSVTVDQHLSATVDQHLSATYDRHLSVTGDRHLSVTVDQHLSATVDQHLSATYDRHLSVTGDRHLSVTVDQHLSATVDQHLSATHDRHLSLS